MGSQGATKSFPTQMIVIEWLHQLCQAFLLPLALARSRRHLTVAAAAAAAAAGYGAGAMAALGQVGTAAVAEVVMAVAQPAAPLLGRSRMLWRYVKVREG